MNERDESGRNRSERRKRQRNREKGHTQRSTAGGGECGVHKGCCVCADIDQRSAKRGNALVWELEKLGSAQRATQRLSIATCREAKQNYCAVSSDAYQDKRGMEGLVYNTIVVKRFGGDARGVKEKEWTNSTAHKDPSVAQAWYGGLVRPHNTHTCGTWEEERTAATHRKEAKVRAEVSVVVQRLRTWRHVEDDDEAAFGHFNCRKRRCCKLKIRRDLYVCFFLPAQLAVRNL